MHSTRADSVTANSLCDEIQRNRACHTDNSAFSGAIRKASINRNHTCDRSYIDKDSSSRILCDHLCHSILGTQEDSPRIDTYQALPILKAGLKDIANMTDPRIIDQDIE